MIQDQEIYRVACQVSKLLTSRPALAIKLIVSFNIIFQYNKFRFRYFFYNYNYKERFTI